ncbi:hypothetical protein Gotur_022504, partial [Gossypium turneri]
MVMQMQEKFNKYWLEYSSKLSCTAILNPRYKLNYVQYCFTTIYGTHASDFVQTILNNLKLLLDKYGKNSKSMSSSLARSFNVSDNVPVDSSLHQLNVNRVDLGREYDESASESTFSMVKKVITSLRSSLKPKTVQAVVCFDDWMRSKGFSTDN